jgi:HPt (histidine-containing phosphotransfer) domain-containing protein
LIVYDLSRLMLTLPRQARVPFERKRRCLTMFADGMGDGRIEIDFSVIEDLADGDPDTLTELITMFVRHTSDAIAGVRAAVEVADFARAARVVHTCIGFTASLGISNLLPLLRKLERASKDAHPDDIVRYLAQWQTQFELARHALQNRIQKSS